MTVGLLLVLSLALLPACGGRQRRAPTAEVEAAWLAVQGASDLERCAAPEYRAAQRLAQQAQDAYDRRQWDLARQLAEATQVQLQRAREAAARNPDCNPDLRPQNLTPLPEQVQSVPLDRDWEGDHVFAPVYFAFDQSSLSPEAGAIVSRHARWLQQHPEVSLILEGHCDEAGSTEYNLALGERRARAVRSYLAELGVGVDRMRMVSYGEEMPARPGNNDLNRRVEFRPRTR
jgi:peptidoglycan-associated lipoprotein